MTMRASVFAMKYRMIIRARARRFPRATWSAWNPSNRFSKEFTIGAIPIIRRSMPSAFANFFASFRSFPPFPSGIDREDPLRTECVRAQLGDEGRIDAAAEPEHDPLPTALPERMDEEGLDDEDLFLLEPRDQLGHGDATFGSGINPCGAKPLSHAA